MKTINVSQEKTESSNVNSLSKIIFKAIFSVSFMVGATSLMSYQLNQGNVLTYGEQLALMSNSDFASSLAIFLILLPLYRVFEMVLFYKNQDLFNISFWTPIKYASLSCLFIPFEQNQVMTSNAVEIIKYIVKFLAN